MNQLTIVIGILVAQIMNYLIAEPVPMGFTNLQILHSWNGQTGWRWMFWMENFPALIFLISIFFIPESARWLLKSGRDTAGMKILNRLGNEDFARREMSHIKETLHSEKGALPFRELLSPGLGKILFLGIFLTAFQQWSGINVIFNYAEEIFTSAGFSISDTLFNIVLTGSVNLVFTFVAIGTVDKLGRKKLMLAGAFGLGLIYILLGIFYYLHIQGVFVLVMVTAAIATYAMTLAPVTWVIISEIFPNRVRGVAMSVATFSLWSACFLLTYTFPWLNRVLGTAGTFWLYSGICLVGFLVIRSRLPETKGKSLERIEQEIVYAKGTGKISWSFKRRNGKIGSKNNDQDS
jgi:SP family sugar porter-like MFS transporter